MGGTGSYSRHSHCRDKIYTVKKIYNLTKFWSIGLDLGEISHSGMKLEGNEIFVNDSFQFAVFRLGGLVQECGQWKKARWKEAQGVFTMQCVLGKKVLSHCGWCPFFLLLSSWSYISQERKEINKNTNNK